MPRRRPSIFEEIVKRMRRQMERGFRLFGGKEPPEEEFRDPFEEMVRGLEEKPPEELEEFVTERETPRGRIRRLGPFVYGFSYSKKPGEEPEVREFGNVSPTGRGEVRPAPRGEREPLVEVVDLDGRYEVTVELPGVEREEVNLSATENSMSVETLGERKFRKEVNFEDRVNPEEADANFRSGVLTVEIEKKGEGEGRKIEVK